MDPPVSVPIVAGVSSAANAEAEPPEDPPGTNFSPYGFFTFPKNFLTKVKNVQNFVRNLKKKT